MKGYCFLREQCIVERMEFHFVKKRGMPLAGIFIRHFKAEQLCAAG